MRNRIPGYITAAIACIGLMCAPAVAADTTQQRMKTVAPTKTAPTNMQKTAPSKIQKMAPAMRKLPQQEDTRPDLTLGACKVECSRGGDYSEQVCQQFGYSDEFTYRVKAPMRNSGKSAASIEAGWRVWSATHQVGSNAAAPAGSAQSQAAPAGGLYLAPDALVPGSSSPIVHNLHDLAPGVHRVVFTTDPENHVAEKDENNNTSQCQWAVEDMQSTPPFDLAVTHISVSPSSGPPSTDFQFTVTVKNVGGATFDTVTTSCQPGAIFLTPELEENETAYRTYSIPGPMTPGTKTINCEVYSHTTEQDTSNNTMTATFTVTAP